MSAWAGVDLAVVREAVAAGDSVVRFELSRNWLGGQALINVTAADPVNPRRKPRKVLPGPLVGDDFASLLRTLADVMDGTIESLVVTDPRDEAAQ
jgi:hypothetical protein